MREVASEGSPYVHMQSTWFFAGLMLLPPPLLVGLIVISFLHEWHVVFRGRALAHRKVFSASTVILGAAAASLVFTAFVPNEPLYRSMVNGPLGLVALVGAGLLYWLVNYALVVGAIVASNPDRPARTALGHPSDQLIIAGSIGLGSGIAVVVVYVPWWTPGLLFTVLAVHLGLLIPQLRSASQTDSKTGLVDPVWWQSMADRELERARRLRSTVAVLMLDLDHFKQVNDRYGHLAGDRVLCEVSTAIRHAVRGYDLVGRWGGEEFAVLMPGLAVEDVHAAAERIRTAVASLTVTTLDRTNTEVRIEGLSVSIGAGVYPETAHELSPLLLATDDALLRAKELGRNRVVSAPGTGSATGSPTGPPTASPAGSPADSPAADVPRPRQLSD